jgi:hypothetical protein
MATLSPTTVLLTALALDQFDNPRPAEVKATTNHKEIVKRDKTPKPKRPGRDKPAKGYDPVTKTWGKP